MSALPVKWTSGAFPPPEKALVLMGRAAPPGSGLPLLIAIGVLVEGVWMVLDPVGGGFHAMQGAPLWWHPIPDPPPLPRLDLSFVGRKLGEA